VRPQADATLTINSTEPRYSARVVCLPSMRVIGIWYNAPVMIGSSGETRQDDHAQHSSYRSRLEQSALRRWCVSRQLMAGCTA
jgi:hypothetical protein